jgi:molybdopterin-guanine dinucleotide biosynthesis protein A
MTFIVGVVLAGGQSTRMGGQDKCLLELGGQTLLQRAAERLAAQLDMIAVNANSDASGYQNTGFPVIPDSFEGYAGPLAGVLAGMEWAQTQGADHIATVAADTPFFPEEFVRKMQIELAAQPGKIAIAETSGSDARFHNHPTFGLWPVALCDDLRSALDAGVRKVVQWAHPHTVVKVRFDAIPFDPFFNINRPEDYETAKQMLKEFAL